MHARIEEIRTRSETRARTRPQQSRTTFFSGVAIALRDYLKTRGQNGLAVLEAVGLDRDTLEERNTRFSIEQLAAAFEISSRRLNDPLFGLRFGEFYVPPVRIAGHYAISSSKDLREALQTVRDYRSRVVGMPTQLLDHSAFTELRWNIDPTSFSRRHIIDFMATRTLRHIQQATGPDWQPLRVDLESEEPENLSDHLRLFGSNIHFGQPMNTVRVDADALSMPMPNADPDLHLVARGSLPRPLSGELVENDPVDQLTRFVSGQLEKNGSTLARASDHMKMTQHQLRRLLKQHGTCFQCVVDDTRKVLARHYLTETDLRFAEITFLLGFSDQSVFTRAVKRWFGVTPKQLRQST